MSVTESELTAKLAQWLEEFREVGGDQEKLPGFLSRRIVESGLTDAVNDPDILLARFPNGARKVRVRGQMPGTPLVHYDELNGGGLGILPAREFMDQNALVECLRRLGTARMETATVNG
jgi:hypothetical protein